MRIKNGWKSFQTEPVPHSLQGIWEPRRPHSRISWIECQAYSASQTLQQHISYLHDYGNCCIMIQLRQGKHRNIDCSIIQNTNCHCIVQPLGTVDHVESLFFLHVFRSPNEPNLFAINLNQTLEVSLLKIQFIKYLVHCTNTLGQVPPKHRSFEQDFDFFLLTSRITKCMR